MYVWTLFSFCMAELFGRLKRVGYHLLFFLHFSIANKAQSQHTLNPDAKEFRPSFGTSERFQRNGSNRYALYFILLCTINFKYF